MGIIEKPDVNETDGLVTALQEDGDAAEQNAMFSGVVGWIEERFTKSNDIRLNDEKGGCSPTVITVDCTDQRFNLPIMKKQNVC